MERVKNKTAQEQFMDSLKLIRIKKNENKKGIPDTNKKQYPTRAWGANFSASGIVSLLVVLITILPSKATLSASLIKWNDVASYMELHPLLIQAKTEILAAQGEVKTAKQYPNPELSLSFGNVEESEATQKESVWDIEVSLPLEYFPVVRNRSKAAALEADATGHEFTAVEWEVYKQLRSKYLVIVADQALTQTMNESEAQMVKLAESVRLKVEHGEIRPMELNRIENELIMLRLELTKLSIDYQTHRDQLNLWLDNPFDREFTVEEPVQGLPELPALETFFERIETYQPLIKSAESRHEQAKVNLRSEQLARLPELSTGVYYEHEPEAKKYGVSISCSLPMWNRNSGEITKARAAVSKSEQDIQLARKQLKELIVIEYAMAQQAQEAISKYVSTIIPRTQKAVTEVETLYHLGEVDLMEVFDTRRALIQAQKDLITSQFQYHLNMLELTAIAGGFDKQQLKSISE